MESLYLFPFFYFPHSFIFYAWQLAAEWSAIHLELYVPSWWNKYRMRQSTQVLCQQPFIRNPVYWLYSELTFSLIQLPLKRWWSVYILFFGAKTILNVDSRFHHFDFEWNVEEKIEISKKKTAEGWVFSTGGWRDVIEWREAYQSTKLLYILCG